MKLQLSSGHGPAECELAVGKFLQSLQQEFADLQVLHFVAGKHPNTYRCVQLKGGEHLSALAGTIQWICPSPYRKNLKRKNWFIASSLYTEESKPEFDHTQVRFETFRSSGKGGQHVNKVETGVRAVYLPTGMSVVSTESRSQYQNKKTALQRLYDAITVQNIQAHQYVKTQNHLEHYSLERGNPIRVYCGMDFRRIK